ncbi:hypothetical protein HMPREF0880_03350 [Yokenella regensburgei ATCC 43003]|nr:hypothetical protein HMPREF0880_03350 [Yokenella regensburgei ATCC 43003]
MKTPGNKRQTEAMRVMRTACICRKQFLAHLILNYLTFLQKYQAVY